MRVQRKCIFSKIVCIKLEGKDFWWLFNVESLFYGLIKVQRHFTGAFVYLYV